MQKLVFELNIRHLKAMVAHEYDEQQRRYLLRLIEDEGDKLRKVGREQRNSTSDQHHIG